MKEDVKKKMSTIDALSMGDDRYYLMLKELRALEPKYEAVLRTLSDDQQDILCDYVSLCEEMSRRKLDIACTHMSFPK